MSDLTYPKIKAELSDLTYPKIKAELSRHTHPLTSVINHPVIYFSFQKVGS